MQTVNIGNKERPVRYNFNAIIEFEEITGVDLSSNSDATLFTKPKNLRALAFCGLKHGAKSEKQEVDFTLEDVGGWLDAGSMASFFQVYVKDNSTGEHAETAEGEEPKK